MQVHMPLQYILRKLYNISCLILQNSFQTMKGKKGTYERGKLIFAKEKWALCKGMNGEEMRQGMIYIKAVYPGDTFAIVIPCKGFHKGS